MISQSHYHSFQCCFTGAIDFNQLSRGVVFASGGQNTVCFSITTVPDDLFEGFEEFFVNLTTFDPAVVLLPQTASVTIADDDGKC